MLLLPSISPLKAAAYASSSEHDDGVFDGSALGRVHITRNPGLRRSQASPTSPPTRPDGPVEGGSLNRSAEPQPPR